VTFAAGVDLDLEHDLDLERYLDRERDLDRDRWGARLEGIS